MTLVLPTRCGGTLEVPSKTAEHLVAHEGQVEGYRPIGELLEELATLLDLPRDGSFVSQLVDFGRVIGRSGAVAHSDEDWGNDPVLFAYRKGRTIPSRVVTEGQGAEVTTLAVVATAIPGREAEGAYTLLTAYPTDEISPREPLDPDLTTEEQVEKSLDWWRKNALVFDPSVMWPAFTSTWNKVLGRVPAEVKTTERITLTLGFVSGYGHQNEGVIDELATLKDVVGVGISLAECVLAEQKIFPSFVARSARTGYSHRWGCPVGGEFVVVFEGTRNDAHPGQQDAALYLAAWTRFSILLKAHFGQATATLEVTQVGLAYLT